MSFMYHNSSLNKFLSIWVQTVCIKKLIWWNYITFKADVPIFQKKPLIFQSPSWSSWEWQLVMRKPLGKSQRCKFETPFYMTDDSY